MCVRVGACVYVCVHMFVCACVCFLQLLQSNPFLLEYFGPLFLALSPSPGLLQFLEWSTQELSRINKPADYTCLHGQGKHLLFPSPPAPHTRQAHTEVSSWGARLSPVAACSFQSCWQFVLLEFSNLDCSDLLLWQEIAHSEKASCAEPNRAKTHHAPGAIKQRGKMQNDTINLLVLGQA